MTELAGAVKRASRTGTILGVLLVLFGILAMMTPLASGLAVSVLIAVLLMVAGFTRLIWAFGAGSFGKGVLTFLLGGLMILCGLAVLATPLAALAGLTLMLAAYFLVDGVMDIIAAFRIRPVNGWSFMLFGGVVTLLLGLMIWRNWPLSGVWAVGTLVGIRVLLTGVEMIALGRLGSRLADNASA